MRALECAAERALARALEAYDHRDEALRAAMAEYARAAAHAAVPVERVILTVVTPVRECVAPRTRPEEIAALRAHVVWWALRAYHPAQPGS